MQRSLTLLLQEAKLKAVVLNSVDSSEKGSGTGVGLFSAVAKS